MKENKIYNAKHEFLKNYLKNKKELADEEIDNVWEFLSEFYEKLPQRAKTHERKMLFSLITSQIQTAFDQIVKKVADCPYVVIEIKDQEKEKEKEQQFKERVDSGLSLLESCSGYLAGGQTKVEASLREINSKIDKV